MTWIDSLVRSEGFDPDNLTELREYAKQRLVHVRTEAAKHRGAGNEKLAGVYEDNVGQLEVWLAEQADTEKKPKNVTAKPRHDSPPANEFGQLRSFLARNGVSQAQITAVIGTGAQGRSRGEIAGLLREWMRELPKA